MEIHFFRLNRRRLNNFQEEEDTEAERIKQERLKAYEEKKSKSEFHVISRRPDLVYWNLS